MFRSTGLFVGLALSLLVVAAALAVPAGAPPGAKPVKITSVPFVIVTPGQYQLASSLTSAVDGAAIDIQVGNVHLNLAGNTLTGPSDCNNPFGSFPASVGIQVGAVPNVHINGGTVGGGFIRGINLVGTMNSQVNGMLVTGNCIFGIRLQGAENNRFNTNRVENTMNPPTHCAAYRLENSDGNVITSNEVVNNGEAAFCDSGIELLNSNDNVIRGNGVLNNSGFGIRLVFDSDRNTIRGNTVSGNLGTGILLGVGQGQGSMADGNLIQSNAVSMSLGHGIGLEVGAGTTTGNTVKSNTSNLNGAGFFDMFEDNPFPQCVNAWSSNIFGFRGGAGALCIF